MSKRAKRSAYGGLELEQLLEIATAKRSKVANLRPLKEQALEKVASFEYAQTSLAPFQYLSPPLQKEILSHVAAQQRCSEDWLTPAKAEWLFEMVSRLLNANTKEFDFGIFGGPNGLFHWSDHERNQKVWNMLVEKCPNLERILDKRHHDNSDAWTISSPVKTDPKKGFYLRNVMPFLQKFTKLKHIVLENYICDSEDLAQLAHHFPKLQTLSVAFKLVYFNTLRNLFLLQNLERLDINWNEYDFRNIKDKLLYNEQTHYLDHLNTECMEQLPCLQYCSGGRKHHNHRPYRGHRKLALREIDVMGGFDFQLVPFLEKLHLNGPLNMQMFKIRALSNLTSLSLSDIKKSDVSYLLTQCGAKLHELKIDIWDSEEGINPYEVMVECPQLRKLDFDTFLCDGEAENDFIYQVNANHFKYMKDFSFSCNDDYFPPDLITLVLATPALEKFSFKENWNLSYDHHLVHLTEQLVEGRILQNLKSFEFMYLNHEPSACIELVKFLCLLAAHAPRLELIRCIIGRTEFEKEAKKSFLFGGIDQIDGFKFILQD
ncbi:uncharacterized protein LOC132201374 [Neocloeon triangulifer]|uniref:uncharacterized protein LOC132201374 n=1 Tax=Neocloeon triangulifer TaxID=2078957 RepID=UPI00286F8767|nr:uncharacterized protein LOC132201374 [Neocloeon triangulifer]